MIKNARGQIDLINGIQKMLENPRPTPHFFCHLHFCLQV